MHMGTNVIIQGGEKYQQAFYVFEELAQAPSTSAPKSLVGQAVAELHLGRLPEAEAALEQAVQKDPEDVEAIANTIVLNAIAGKKNPEMNEWVLLLICILLGLRPLIQS